MKNTFYYQTVIGKIAIAESDQKITNVSLPNEQPPQNGVIKETEILKEAASQLNDYFLGKRKEFSLPLAPQGTEFMQKVWNALLNIPYAETMSYGQIAKSIGNKNASRAVGMANNRNPIAIIIPCHRVIGSTGKLVGYGGGLPLKTFLLELEQKYGNL